MSNGKDGPLPEIEIADPAEAFRKLEEFTRRVLAVPKKEIDKKLEAEKNKKKRYRKDASLSPKR